MKGREGSMNAREQRMNGCGRTIAWQLGRAFMNSERDECRGIDRAHMNAAGSVGRRQSSPMGKVLLYSHAHGDAPSHTGTHSHIRGRIRCEMVEMDVGDERIE